MAEAAGAIQGKVILITGATSGIGEAAALRLYSLGATVIMHGRHPGRIISAFERIQKAAPHKTGGKLDVLVADLSVMAQVYEMTVAFKQRYNRLDVLVNNAGATFQKRRASPDGVEMTFAVNHLSHFLLTRQLLDVLKTSAPARVITVASDVHYKAKLDLGDYGMEKNYQGMTAYANSKLCNVLFAYELARRMRRMGNLAVTSNAMHPGFVATHIGKNHGWLERSALHFVQHNPITRRGVLTPEQGAETLVYLAGDPAASGVSGKYWVSKEVKPTSVPSYDHDIAAHLWNISELLVQQLVPALRPPEAAVTG
jgi:NAD(P)-dependent dehydrogenase (short-subunit alcohol dehydrogenase family)